MLKWKPRRARDPAGAAPPPLLLFLLLPPPQLQQRPRRAKGKPSRPSSERPLHLLSLTVTGRPRQRPRVPSPGAGSQGPCRRARAGRQKKKKKKKKKKRSKQQRVVASRPAASPQRARLLARRIQRLHHLCRLPGAAPTTARPRRPGGAAAEAREWPLLMLMPAESTLPLKSERSEDRRRYIFRFFLFSNASSRKPSGQRARRVDVALLLLLCSSHSSECHFKQISSRERLAAPDTGASASDAAASPPSTVAAIKVLAVDISSKRLVGRLHPAHRRKHPQEGPSRRA